MPNAQANVLISKQSQNHQSFTKQQSTVQLKNQMDISSRSLMTNQDFANIVLILFPIAAHVIILLTEHGIVLSVLRHLVMVHNTTIHYILQVSQTHFNAQFLDALQQVLLMI